MENWIDKEFYALETYMCYFIKMTYLNACIDATKCSKHSVMDFNEFKTCEFGGELLTDRYTRLFLNGTIEG